LIEKFKPRECTPIEIYLSTPRPLTPLEQWLRTNSVYIIRALCFNKNDNLKIGEL